MKFVPKSVETLVTKLAAVVPGGKPAHLPAEAAPRALLQHWVRAPTTPQRVVTRSRIVLSALDGLSVDEIASQLDVSATTVRLWIARFEEAGTEALLHDAPGRGRRAVVAADDVRDRLREANLVRPDGEPVSIRRAASFLGVSTSSLWRALRKSRRPA